MNIPLACPDLSGNEATYVLDAIQSGWIGAGPYIGKFEAEFARLCKTRAAIACSNGTVALHLALHALGLRAGDEVIVPSFTYVASANSIRYCGGEPVFVDVDESTWCIDPTKIEEAITPRTRGIMAVHLFGHPADMDEINRIARLYNLWVVEDAAEAVFALYKGRPVGSLSDVGSFSFHVNKVITSGEGGALTMSDEQLERFIRMLGSHGMDPKRRFFFPVTGYNYRITNIGAALLCAQLERHQSFISRRKAIIAKYEDCLKGVAGIKFRPVASWATMSPWMFSLTVDSGEFGRTREALMLALASEGIESRPFFIPVHTLPPFRDAPQMGKASLPITSRLCSTGINLPTYTSISDEKIEVISAVIRDIGKSG